MTDHAQREALERTLDRIWAAVPLAHKARLMEQGDGLDPIIAALRASAPPAPEGDKADAQLTEAVDGYLSHLGSHKPLGGDFANLKGRVITAACNWLASRRAAPTSHTARTAIGEPPTGMREVPGTPGLYEPVSGKWTLAEVGVTPHVPTPPIDTDALASETTHEVIFLPFIMRHGLDKSQILEVRAVIRAALDRMKETR